MEEKDEGIQYEARIDQYYTHEKCWKISVNKEQHVKFRITATFKNRNCNFGNISVSYNMQNLDSEYDFNNEYLPNIAFLCASEKSPYPNERSTSTVRNTVLTSDKDVFIRYRSIRHYSNGKDFVNVTFEKVDKMCGHPNAFKCSKNSCISPEKECDEVKDCENGADEENCDYGALSATYLNLNKIKASQWLKSQHTADWSWKENTNRAIVALYLTGSANYNRTNKDEDLFAKQLELEVFTYLLRHKFEKESLTELASYINALLVICHDPRNFYGHDLIATLKDSLQTKDSFAPPFLYLTLCNAKEPISEDEIDNLLEILEISSANHGFVLELQALATMALSCINENQSLHLEQNITEALKNLKSLQGEDGSFGNEYTTALVLQALIANNQENTRDWNPKSSIQFLSNMQQTDGSFGDFLTTYLIMPVLNAKSLVDIGNVNCTGNERPRDGNMVTDIKSRLGKKTIMKYSLFIGDEKDQIHPLLLRTPENITVLELMTLAADIDPKYKFKIHEIKKKKYIYEISNIPNDPENNRFWFIYQGLQNGTVPIIEQSPDKIKACEKDHIIMWYKTLDSL